MKRSRETGLQGTVHVQARHILRSPMTPTVREGLAPLATLAKEIGLDGARHAPDGRENLGSAVPWWVLGSLKEISIYWGSGFGAL